MNRKILFLLPLSLILFGCAGKGLVRVASCDAYTTPLPPCQATPNAPTIGVNTAAAIIGVTPRCVQARRTKTIKFSITPVGPADIGTVAVIPKNPADTWLIGTNSPVATEIEILVPDWATNGDHKYAIVTNGGKCLDPRVRVVD